MLKIEIKSLFQELEDFFTLKKKKTRIRHSRNLKSPQEINFRNPSPKIWKKIKSLDYVPDT